MYYELFDRFLVLELNNFSPYGEIYRIYVKLCSYIHSLALNLS